MDSFVKIGILLKFWNSICDNDWTIVRDRFSRIGLREFEIVEYRIEYTSKHVSHDPRMTVRTLISRIRVNPESKLRKLRYASCQYVSKVGSRSISIKPQVIPIEFYESGTRLIGFHKPSNNQGIGVLSVSRLFETIYNSSPPRKSLTLRV